MATWRGPDEISRVYAELDAGKVETTMDSVAVAPIKYTGDRCCKKTSIISKPC